jgi:hypothetical protein
MSATGTVWDADIQPASTQRQESISGRFGAVFTAFVDVTVTLKRVIRSMSMTKVYSVKGVSVWRGAGLLDHKELLLPVRMPIMGEAISNQDHQRFSDQEEPMIKRLQK